MANVYTSSYTGEQVDVAVAATESLQTTVDNIISGTQIVGQATNAANAQYAVKATGDANGNNIAETYAVKSDYSFISNATATLSGGGWFTIANCKILNGASAFVTVKQMYAGTSPFSLNFVFSQTGYGVSVLTALSSQGSTSGFKLRYLYGSSGSSYLQIYIPYTTANVWYVSVFSAQQGGVVAEINTTTDSTSTPSDGISVEIDVPQNCGINTSGNIYQNGNQVLNMDLNTLGAPSLTSSDWEGWTKCTVGSNISTLENGIYLVALPGQTYERGLMVYKSGLIYSTGLCTIVSGYMAGPSLGYTIFKIMASITGELSVRYLQFNGSNIIGEYAAGSSQWVYFYKIA